MSPKKEKIADLCVIKLSRVNFAGDAWRFTINISDIMHIIYDRIIIV